MTQKRLLILDLNGVMVDSTHRRRRGVDHDMKIGTKYVYMRPRVKEFLHKVIESGKYELAVWSSAVEKNTTPIARELFDGLGYRPLFVYNRSHCTHAERFDTIKDLERVWDRYPCWGPDNTICLDDSPDKLRLQPECLMLVKSFVAGEPGWTDDRELLGIVNSRLLV
jgi:hypothetical protein